MFGTIKTPIWKIIMSAIKRKHSDPKVVEQLSMPENYQPQHPMMAFQGTEAVHGPDHLDDYREVRPFEDSEGLMSGLRSIGKSIRGAASTVGKLASGAIKGVKSARKQMKEDKKAQKEVKKDDDKDDKEEDDKEEDAKDGK